MATEAQLNANRQNAKKSTGPRTPKGKAASSRNSLEHGLCAEKLLLTDEDSDAFLALLRDLFSRFRPVGAGEESLVKRIALAQWRLDRALPIETQIYQEQIAIVAVSNPEMSAKELNAQTGLLGPSFMNDCDRSQTLIKLARYETALERSINNSLRQLEAFQKARTQAVAEIANEPPADVSGEITERTQIPALAELRSEPKPPRNSNEERIQGQEPSSLSQPWERGISASVKSYARGPVLPLLDKTTRWT
jgi:hypothetical protein